MPTENRSSNTEMVSVPRDEIELTVHCLRMAGEESSADDLQAYLDRPAEQHQGEPVAVVTTDASDKQVIEFLSYDLKDGTELYPRADSGEVELKQCEAMAAMIEEREWAEHVCTGTVSSRVEAAFTQLHNELSEARELGDTLRAQLAERDALLRQSIGLLKVAAERLPRKHQTIRAHIDHLAQKFDAALSASAEPMYPRVEIVRAHKHTCASCKEGAEHGPCDCGAVVDGVAVPVSAPVERDERGEFEAEWRKRYPGHPPLALKRSGLDSADYVNTRTKDAWWAWQARAALERKPS